MLSKGYAGLGYFLFVKVDMDMWKNTPRIEHSIK
jgi:hypothetical protein